MVGGTVDKGLFAKRYKAQQAKEASALMTKNQQAKDREDAMHALAAKRKREEMEKALQGNSEGRSGRVLFTGKDPEAEQYYQGARQRNTPPSSGSGKSARASGASRARSSVVEKENLPPEDPNEQYPGWGRGDGFEGQDVTPPYMAPDPEADPEEEERVLEGVGSDGTPRESESDGETDGQRVSLARRGPRDPPTHGLALANRCKG